jgi:uncharacterized protein (UPF0333 family)
MATQPEASGDCRAPSHLRWTKVQHGSARQRHGEPTHASKPATPLKSPYIIGVDLAASPTAQERAIDEPYKDNETTGLQAKAHSTPGKANKGQARLAIAATVLVALLAYVAAGAFTSFRLPAISDLSTGLACKLSHWPPTACVHKYERASIHKYGEAARATETVQPGKELGATATETVQPGKGMGATATETVQPRKKMGATATETVQPRREMAATAATEIVPTTPV